MTDSKFSDLKGGFDSLSEKDKNFYKAFGLITLAVLSYVTIPGQPLLSGAIAFVGGAGISELQDKIIINSFESLFTSDKSANPFLTGLFSTYKQTVEVVKLRWKENEKEVNDPVELIDEFFNKLSNGSSVFFLGIDKVRIKEDMNNLILRKNEDSEMNIIDLDSVSSLIQKQWEALLVSDSKYGEYQIYSDRFRDFIKGYSKEFTKMWTENFKHFLFQDTNESRKARVIYEILWRRNVEDIVAKIPILEDRLRFIEDARKDDEMMNDQLREFLDEILLRSKPHEVHAQPYSFVNRDLEIEKAVNYFSGLKDQIGITVITGPTGIGKSELANTLAIKLKDLFTDGIIRIDLTGIDRLEKILTQLRRKVDQSFKRTTTDDTALEDFLTYVTKKKVLVIFDNVNEPEFVSYLKSMKPDSSTSGFIITTQNQEVVTELGVQDSSIFLEPLNETNALELFKKVLGEERVNKNIESLDLIIKYLHGLPLALDIISKNISTLDERILSLEKYAKLLESESKRLDYLKRGNIEVEAVFNIAFERLSEQSKNVLILLSSIPQSEIQKNIDLISYILEINEFAAASSANELHTLSLMQVTDEGLFRVHPLIGIFANSKAGERRLIDKDEIDIRVARYLISEAKKFVTQKRLIWARDLADLSQSIFSKFNDEVGQLEASFIIAKIAQSLGNLNIAKRMGKNLVRKEKQGNMDLGIAKWYAELNQTES